MRIVRSVIPILLLGASFVMSSCSAKLESNQSVHQPVASIPPAAAQVAASPTPIIPILQTELLDDRNKTTISPIGNFDFKNYKYELPRGWQNPDATPHLALPK